MNDPRRLLKIDDVAKKLATSRSGFTRVRHALEMQGFPQPCLDHDIFGGARWDEKAIDLWLDDRIPDRLQATIKTRQIADAQRADAVLQERARGLNL